MTERDIFCELRELIDAPETPLRILVDYRVRFQVRDVMFALAVITYRDLVNVVD